MQRYISKLRDYQYSRTTVCLLLTLLVTFSNTGCTQTQESSVTNQSDPTQLKTNSSDLPDEAATLNIAVIPASTQQKNNLEPLAEYLTKTLGRPVKFQITKDYDSSVNLLVEEKVDIAYLGALTYIQARLRNPQVQPIVAPIDKITGRPWYTSVIITKKSSGIGKLEDLKGKRFAFVNKSSTSGYLVPMASFKDISINPDKYFSQIKYSGSHDKVKTDLIEGKVDAIADDKRSYMAEQKAGRLPASEYKIIWESQPIPNSPVVVSSKLSPQLIADLKYAFINAPEGMLDRTGSESAGYTLAKDEDYDPVRRLREKLNLK